MIPSVAFIKHLGKKFNFDENYEYSLWRTTVSVNDKIKSIEETFNSYLEVAVDEFKIPAGLIISKSRQQNLTYIRHILAYVCRKNSIGTWSMIGKMLGGRDHSSVMHSYYFVEDMIECKDKEFMVYYNKLKHLINE